MDKEIPKLEMEFEVTKLEPKTRRMDFGKVTVCSKCGNAVFPNPDNPNPTCCGKLMPLKQYMEEVLHKPFNNEEWSFKTVNINNVTDIDMDAEIVNLIPLEGVVERDKNNTRDADW